MWKRWTSEYLRGLRERHNLQHKQPHGRVQREDVVISKDEKLRAGKGHLERAIQQLYPLELSVDRRVDRQVPGTALNPQAGVFRPRCDAAVAAGLRVHDVVQQEQ